MSRPFFKSSCIASPGLFSQGSWKVDSEVEELKDETVTVTGLYVYTTPLVRGLGITHDFLVVRVKHEDSRKDQFIRAEKFNIKGVEGQVQEAGISVKLIKRIEENDVRTLSTAQDLGTIKVAEICEILIGFDPDYDVLGDNCWKYAAVAYKTLLEKFRELSPEGKERIDNYLKKTRSHLTIKEYAKLSAAGFEVGAVGTAAGCSIM